MPKIKGSKSMRNLFRRANKPEALELVQPEQAPKTASMVSGETPLKIALAHKLEKRTEIGLEMHHQEYPLRYPKLQSHGTRSANSALHSFNSDKIGSSFTEDTIEEEVDNSTVNEDIVTRGTSKPFGIPVVTLTQGLAECSGSGHLWFFSPRIFSPIPNVDGLSSEVGMGYVEEVATRKKIAIEHQHQFDCIARAASRDGSLYDSWYKYLEQYINGELNTSRLPSPPSFVTPECFQYLPALHPRNEFDRYRSAVRNTSDWSEYVQQEARAILEIAKKRFNVQHSIISFLDDQMETFYLESASASSRKFVTNATDPKSNNRIFSFSGHSLYTSEVFVVLDARNDWRFVGSPYVTGNAKVRFFACAPIFCSEGYAIAILSLYSREAKPDFTPLDRRELANLGQEIMRIRESDLKSGLGVGAAQLDQHFGTILEEEQPEDLAPRVHVEEYEFDHGDGVTEQNEENEVCSDNEMDVAEDPRSSTHSTAIDVRLNHNSLLRKYGCTPTEKEARTPSLVPQPLAFFKLPTVSNLHDGMHAQYSQQGNGNDEQEVPLAQFSNNASHKGYQYEYTRDYVSDSELEEFPDANDILSTAPEGYQMTGRTQYPQEITRNFELCESPLQRPFLASETSHNGVRPNTPELDYQNRSQIPKFDFALETFTGQPDEYPESKRLRNQEKARKKLEGCPSLGPVPEPVDLNPQEMLIAIFSPTPQPSENESDIASPPPKKGPLRKLPEDAPMISNSRSRDKQVLHGPKPNRSVDLTPLLNWSSDVMSPAPSTRKHVESFPDEGTTTLSEMEQEQLLDLDTLRSREAGANNDRNNQSNIQINSESRNESCNESNIQSRGGRVAALRDQIQKQELTSVHEVNPVPLLERRDVLARRASSSSSNCSYNSIPLLSRSPPPPKSTTKLPPNFWFINRVVHPSLERLTTSKTADLTSTARPFVTQATSSAATALVSSRLPSPSFIPLPAGNMSKSSHEKSMLTLPSASSNTVPSLSSPVYLSPTFRPPKFPPPATLPPSPPGRHIPDSRIPRLAADRVPTPTAQPSGIPRAAKRDKMPEALPKNSASDLPTRDNSATPSLNLQILETNVLLGSQPGAQPDPQPSTQPDPQPSTQPDPQLHSQSTPQHAAQAADQNSAPVDLDSIRDRCNRGCQEGARRLYFDMLYIVEIQPARPDMSDDQLFRETNGLKIDLLASYGMDMTTTFSKGSLLATLRYRSCQNWSRPLVDNPTDTEFSTATHLPIHTQSGTLSRRNCGIVVAGFRKPTNPGAPYDNTIEWSEFKKFVIAIKPLILELSTTYLGEVPRLTRPARSIPFDNRVFSRPTSPDIPQDEDDVFHQPLYNPLNYSPRTHGPPPRGAPVLDYQSYDYQTYDSQACASRALPTPSSQAHSSQHMVPSQAKGYEMNQ